MPLRIEEHTGARLARTRKARHLTQRQLAERSNVSYSTITKIEQGAMAASPSVIGALARALSVPTTDLTGQPYLDELRHDQLDALIQPIRAALDVYDLGPDLDVTPRDADAVAADVERLCALARATDFKKVAVELPGLIEEATTAAHLHPCDQAWKTLAMTYRTAYDVTIKLGYTDLCTVALDRMGWAARRGSSPALSSARQYMRSLVYLRAGEYAMGQRLIRKGLAIVEQAEPGRERDVVTGQLHLGASVLYARDQDGDNADGHLNEAHQIAQRTGPAEKVHWLSFGPTNVDVHRVAVLAERDLYPEAVAAAHQVAIPSDWPLSRVSHHYAEVARALLWMGKVNDSFELLRQARRAAPQQTKYHPLVRETYAGLTAAKRAMPNTFSNYGNWLGM